LKGFFAHWLALACLALPFLALAETAQQTCEPGVYQILAKELLTPALKVSIETEPGNVVASACKLWPYKPHLLIAVVVFDESKEFEKQLVIALIDRRTGRVNSNFRSATPDDNFYKIDDHSFVIDTSPFQLAKSTRAFGVRFRNAAVGPSSPDQTASEFFTLYIPSGASIAPVYSIALSQQMALRGVISTMYPGAVWEDAEISLATTKKLSNGLLDIEAKAKISVVANDLDDVDFKDRKNRIETQILRFDGRKYRPYKAHPWWLN
jgi:hypothetical protein